MLFRRHTQPRSAAELANEAEIEKLAEDATRGELTNEVTAIRRQRRLFPLLRPLGFFNSPGVAMPDDKPYEGDAEPRL